MADTATDIRTLIRVDGSDPDRAAVAHVVVSIGFLAIGAILAGLAMLSMAFPAVVPLGYGFLRAATMLCLLVGFGIVSVIGGAYYVLPRLTGAPLWNEGIARLGAFALGALTLVGVIAVAAGLGDGREPFNLAWWLDIPIIATLALPAAVAIRTVRERTEASTYVTVPFVLTGLIALPLLYTVGAIPGLRSIGSLLADQFSGAALVTVTMTIAVGLVYYAIVKENNRPLAGRQLATVGYWSLLFGAGWFGVAQLNGAPIPEWSMAVAAVLGLGLPVGLLATLANVVETTDGAWSEPAGPSPVVRTAVTGLTLAAVVSVLAAAATFRTPGALVALTPFWDGIVFSFLLGVLPLLLSVWMYQAIPRMMGRLLVLDRFPQQIRLTTYGTAAYLLFMTFASMAIGFGWAGGTYTGSYNAIGEGWIMAVGAGQTFLGLAVVGGIVAVLGNLAMASTVFRTITQGHVTTQEVLVGYIDEGDDDE